VLVDLMTFDQKQGKHLLPDYSRNLDEFSEKLKYIEFVRSKYLDETTMKN
jgi:hypothetical protein